MLKENYKILETLEQNFLTLQDVKSYLRISHSSDDKMILYMINSALNFAENFLDHHIIPKKLEIYFFNIRNIIIQQKPFIKLESLSNGRAMLSPAEYEISGNRIDFKKLYPKICLEGVFGILDESEFDPSLRDAILNHITLLYDKRGNPDIYSYQAKSFYRDFRNINI